MGVAAPREQLLALCGGGGEAISVRRSVHTGQDGKRRARGQRKKRQSVISCSNHQLSIRHLTAPHTMHHCCMLEQCTNCIQSIIKNSPELSHRVGRASTKCKRRGDFSFNKLFLINYLRVIIVAETFSEGVVVYFQLSDLCEEEEEEGSERKSASRVRNKRGGLWSVI